MNKNDFAPHDRSPILRTLLLLHLRHLRTKKPATTETVHCLSFGPSSRIETLLSHPPAVRFTFQLLLRTKRPCKIVVFAGGEQFCGTSRLWAHRLLISVRIMGNSHNPSCCHALRLCVPANEPLSCLTAGSLRRPHSSPRSSAGCCESGSAACTLRIGKMNLGRPPKAAASVARSRSYVHTLLVLPIGCFDSWKGQIFAVSC
jgi:hypothetical protein